MAASVIPRTMDKVTALRQTDLFGSLSGDVLEEIAALAVTRHISRGQILFSEHNEASNLYVVTRGEFRSIRQNLDGRQQVLSTQHPGDILAAVSVFNGGRLYSTVIAEARSEVLGIEKRHVRELCRKHTELLWNLAMLLARTVSRHADLIESLALRNVDQRVAQYLLMVAQERGVPVGEGCMVELTLTRTDIASRLGSAREVVSRAFTRLQNCGLIQMKGCRLVTVANMQALRAFGGMYSQTEKVRVISEPFSEMAW